MPFEFLALGLPLFNRWNLWRRALYLVIASTAVITIAPMYRASFYTPGTESNRELDATATPASASMTGVRHR